MNILYVDDDYNDLALFGIAIDKLDLDIWLFTAVDGQQAIDYLKGTGSYSDRLLHPLPQVILLDLKMRRTTGFDFLEWRRHTPFASIPVVAFTSFASPLDKEQALELGAELCLAKPLGFEELKACVRRVWDFALERMGEAPGAGAAVTRETNPDARLCR